MPRLSRARPFKGNLTEPRDLISAKGVTDHNNPRGLTGTIIVGDDTGLIRLFSAKKGDVVAEYGEQNPLYRVRELNWVIPRLDDWIKDGVKSRYSQFLSVHSNGDIRLNNSRSGFNYTLVRREHNLLSAFVTPSPMDEHRMLWSITRDGNLRTWLMDTEDLLSDNEEEDSSQEDEDHDPNDGSFGSMTQRSRRRGKSESKRRRIKATRGRLKSNYSMRITGDFLDSQAKGVSYCNMPGSVEAKHSAHVAAAMADPTNDDHQTIPSKKTAADDLESAAKEKTKSRKRPFSLTDKTGLFEEKTEEERRRDLRRRTEAMKRRRKSANAKRNDIGRPVWLNDLRKSTVEKNRKTEAWVLDRDTGEKVLVGWDQGLNDKVSGLREKAVKSDHWMDARLSRDSIAHLMTADRRGNVLSSMNLNDLIEQRRLQREYERTKMKKKNGDDSGKFMIEYDVFERKHHSCLPFYPHKPRKRNRRPLIRKYDRTKDGSVWIKPNRMGIEGITHFKGEILCCKPHPSLMGFRPDFIHKNKDEQLTENNDDESRLESMMKDSVRNKELFDPRLQLGTKFRSFGNVSNPWIAVGGYSKEVEIWDVCRQKRVFKGLPFVDHLDVAHIQSVVQLDWSMKHPHLVVSCTNDSSLRTHDLRAGFDRKSKQGVIRQRISNDYSISKMMIKSDKKVMVGDSSGQIFEFDYLRPVKQRGLAYRRYRHGKAMGAIVDFAAHPTRNLFASVGLGRYMSVHRFEHSRFPLKTVYLKTKPSSVLWLPIFDTHFRKRFPKKKSDVSDDGSEGYESSDDEDEEGAMEDFLELSEEDEMSEMSDNEDNSDDELGSEREDSDDGHEWGAVDEDEVNEILSGYDRADLQALLRSMDSSSS